MGSDIFVELREMWQRPNLYYLHGDHLGTATFVTEQNAEATQFFLNLFFGETMAEQMTGVYENPYKLNAKELNNETGLYYYGARYYNPRVSVWYGVDPLTEKMPSWSPYSYTFDNPINFIDPDGREPIGGSGGPGPKKGGVRFILNLAAGPDMYDAAKTRMKQIRNNYPNDKIVELTESNLGKLSGVVKNELAKAKKEGYGKTYELSVFSHAGTDGPVGSFDPKNTYDLSVESGEATDKGQMSLEGWSKINWNFDSGNSVAAFYGCQSDAFAEKFMGISDVFYTAGVGGRAGGSKVISGDFSGTIANSFGLSSGDVYLRSQTDGKVDPLTVYRRGHTEKVTQPDKSTRRYLKPIEYYRNATVPSK